MVRVGSAAMPRAEKPEDHVGPHGRGSLRDQYASRQRPERETQKQAGDETFVPSPAIRGGNCTYPVLAKPDVCARHVGLPLLLTANNDKTRLLALLDQQHHRSIILRLLH